MNKILLNINDNKVTELEGIFIMNAQQDLDVYKITKGDNEYKKNNYVAVISYHDEDGIALIIKGKVQLYED